MQLLGEIKKLETIWIRVKESGIDLFLRHFALSDMSIVVELLEIQLILPKSLIEN